MWHEARKQEKKIRGLMVDYKKRAERRREYYEKIKLDPTQFLRVYGRPIKINLDPAVAIAAESPQSMMPWQGDHDNMIDRFDVRAHLDIMPQFKIVAPPTLSRKEEVEERHANYERYRTLVENECAGVNEEQALYQIYVDEQFGVINKNVEEEKEKKNKLAGKKAAIGFTYEDSTTGPAEEEEEDESDASSDTDVETVDLDVTLDVNTLNDEQKKLLNLCAQQFGMRDDDYIAWLSKDKEEQEELRMAKLLEEEKAQFAGRKSRRERRAYKEKRLAGRKLSPPSYAARDSPKYEPYKRQSSSSRSRSRSPEPVKTSLEFITSFGGDSDDEEGVVQGPSLPPHLNISKQSSDDKWSVFNIHEDKKGTSSKSRSRNRSRSSTGDKPKHDSKKRKVSPRRQSSSESPRKRPYRRSRSGSSRSRSRSRSRSSRSTSSRSRSRSRSYSSSSRSRSRSRSRSYSRSSYSRSTSRGKSR
ncbi:hypothetical protein FSP39_011096 [Pinctada imbricata]|uniref:Suppressor of white apricot N-terminal domain-containing protein n=1 Tax=Pinctada imbricata TaxID=66713 RepID=A0AA88XV80_PINIB|nr:hypothetical protein FSP39_011096 [Pinctada imbricata]